MLSWDALHLTSISSPHPPNLGLLNVPQGREMGVKLRGKLAASL